MIWTVQREILHYRQNLVDGVNPVVTLTNTPAINTKIMVVRRIGKRWTDPGTPLRLQENNIGRFLRNKEVALPK